MINKERRDYLMNELNAEVALFENPSFDDSIIGISATEDYSTHLIYSFNQMIVELMQDEKMTESEAVEFIEYNTIRSLPYIEEEIRPIIMYELVI